MQTKLSDYAVMGDKIIVRPDSGDMIKASGLVIPAFTRHAVDTGTVVAVGPGETTSAGVRIPMEVAVGDRVCWTQRTGIEMEIDGEKLLVLTPRLVNCKLVD